MDNNNIISKDLKNSEDSVFVEEEKIKNTIAVLASKVDIESSEESQNESTDTKIADLAKACADSILNPDFLHGEGEPFTTSMPSASIFSSTDSRIETFTEDLSSSSKMNLKYSSFRQESLKVTSVFSNGCQFSKFSSQTVGKFTALKSNHTQSVAPSDDRQFKDDEKE